MYVPLVAAAAGGTSCRSRYISHITGHGLLKLMRPARALTYRIERLPPVPAVLELPRGAGRPGRRTRRIRRSTWAPATRSTAHPGAGERVVELAGDLGLRAMLAGRVEEGPRQVILEPVGVRFAGDELELS